MAGARGIGKRGPGAPVAGDQPTGAVAQHVGVRVADRRDHPPRHGGRLHRELGVHAGDPEVEAVQQLLGLVEPAVVEDVHLDPLEQGEAGAR